jgi:hypothetical protein
LRTGRKPDAVRSLIRGAQSAVAYQDPYTTAEILIEISNALKLIEITQGNALMDEAQKFCRVKGLPFDRLSAELR